MLSKILRLAVASTLVMAAGTVGAATSTTTLNVSAKVASNCSVTATSLVFPDYDASAQIDGTTSLSVNCSKGTPYTIKLNGGTNGNIAQRLLRDASTNFLQYNLYTDAGRTSVWGQTTGTDTSGGTGNGMSAAKAISHTVYGRIVNSTVNQDAPAGNYTDAVLVTVEY
jgi:spore coat protein U-like protein